MKQPQTFIIKKERMAAIGQIILAAVSMATSDLDATPQEAIAALRTVARFLEHEHEIRVIDTQEHRPTHNTNAMNN